jgi:hypothetical protein
MNTHRIALISFVGIASLVGCSAPTGAEATGSENSAVVTSLPSDPNWATGLSADALQVGTDNDGSPLYSCRALVSGSLQVGKIKKGWPGCDIGYGGQEISESSYQTLVPTWSASTYGSVPPNAAAFGNEADGTPLYVCRGIYAGTLQTGKVRPGLSGCLVPYGGTEVSIPAYQVLTNTNVLPVTEAIMHAGYAFPKYAINGGTDGNGASLYLCLAPYAGGLIPGKMQATWSGCNVSYGGAEYTVSSPDFEVLVPSFDAPVVASNPYVAGTDANGSPLGVCSVPYGGGTQVGKFMSSGVCDFGYGGKEVAPSAGFSVLATFRGSAPLTFTFPSITFPSGVALGGSAQVTLNSDGSYVFSGHFHDSGALAYNENTVVVVRAMNGTAFTFSRSGSSYGTFESGSRDDNWSISGTNPAIAAAWGDLTEGGAWGVQAQQTSSVSLDFSSMWSSLQQDIGYVSQVVAVVGAVL